MGYQKWDKVETREEGSSRREDSDDNFLKFKQGKFRVRLVKDPYFYEQHFIPAEAMTGMDKTLPVISPGADDPLIPLGFTPGQKCAFNAIDRDTGKLVILRCGYSVYGVIAEYAKAAEINPGSSKGPDFQIKVVDPDGNARQRKYTVTTLNPTPFTKEERDMIRENGVHDLETIFKSKTVEEVNEIIEKYNIGAVSGSSEFEDSGSSGSESITVDDDDEDGDLPF
jgi:hypothetical protein